MASNLKNLSDYKPEKVPSASEMSFGIAVSEWNKEITNALFQGAYNTLLKHGAKEENIVVITVPGSFELVHTAVVLGDNYSLDAIICIGCIIRGETPHFNYICQGVTQGIANLNATGQGPVIFGVLTTNNLQEAKDRAGGKYGNKGDEAAITAIHMVQVSNDHYYDETFDPDNLYFN